MDKEYLDVLDENGNKIGKKKLRSEIHRDGDWHKHIHVWIVNSQGQLLLQKRAADKDSHPNQWDTSCAGHIPAGLDSTQAALKELNEELGIEIKKEQLEFLFECKRKKMLNNGSFINNGHYDIFLLEMDLDVNSLSFQKEEISELKFFDVDSLKKELKQENPAFVAHPIVYPKIFELIKEKKT